MTGLSLDSNNNDFNEIIFNENVLPYLSDSPFPSTLCVLVRCVFPTTLFQNVLMPNISIFDGPLNFIDLIH